MQNKPVFSTMQSSDNEQSCSDTEEIDFEENAQYQFLYEQRENLDNFSGYDYNDEDEDE